MVAVADMGTWRWSGIGSLASCWAVLRELLEGRAQGCLVQHPASWLRAQQGSLNSSARTAECIGHGSKGQGREVSVYRVSAGGRVLCVVRWTSRLVRSCRRKGLSTG